ncbi:unnamed protein product [Lactuca virosa]|uniref:Uncharacterized protein n=1 Tax=Lactuca virosa TaxID=75947 RepID=A0AAU9LUB8_9ASTR|nr:unnamed protein product [Lactuca virosa]
MVNIANSENLAEEEKTSFGHGEGVRKAEGVFDGGCGAERGSSCGLQGVKRLNLGMGVGMGGPGMRFGFGVGMGTGTGIGSTGTGTGTSIVTTGGTGTGAANIGTGTGDGVINETISVGTMDANDTVNANTETEIGI